ncbi:NADH:ubiquinone reductase (Na(+)-transporting) subunit F [Phycicoccus sp. Soil748]|uniref:NADH:ubiquinone reductase (Na(+)-transporting) subunit F n=1 Tax=Phycicoccus sp. Soil748 TaxID=1736397 RepID=UPI00070319C1|nr:2Fe-2S iron-sulfur cluster-binding protein [Phycicoccus sp. Soil748]KRE55430.1 oxidoreductase [Phycicoccus sp. Soil748]
MDTHTITVEPLGREVECREDQTILDACLRSGVWLPHSCTHGTCATCKAEVLDGEVDHGAASSFALMDYERDEGKVLPCVACPRSDVVIEADVDVDDSVEVFPVEDYTGTVVELEEIALQTRRLVIELDREIGFNAGQYLKFQVPARDGMPAVDRTWSIASPPSESRRLEFHIRNVEGGRGTDGWVFGGLMVGDRVSVSGPYGRFVLRTGDDRHAILVGGGTGLAPLKSMLRHALEDDAYEGRLTLYQGARTREWLYDVEYFRGLAARYPDRFTYRPCLSDEAPEDCGADAADYGFGLVTDVIAADHASLSGSAGYLCGPPPMVDAALKTLMGRRLFPRDIHREDFFNEGDKATGGVRSPLIKR